MSCALRTLRALRRTQVARLIGEEICYREYRHEFEAALVSHHLAVQVGKCSCFVEFVYFCCFWWVGVGACRPAGAGAGRPRALLGPLPAAPGPLSPRQALQRWVAAAGVRAGAAGWGVSEAGRARALLKAAGACQQALRHTLKQAHAPSARPGKTILPPPRPPLAGGEPAGHGARPGAGEGPKTSFWGLWGPAAPPVPALVEA